MATLRGAELTARFEPVGAETMSVIHAKEAHPLKAAKFKLWEFKAARKDTFARELRKRGSGEVRPRFREAHERLKASARSAASSSASGRRSRRKCSPLRHLCP